MPHPNYTVIECIQFAYSELSLADKWYVDTQAARLELLIKERNPEVNFGRLEALELCYKLGVWLRKEGL